MATAQPNAAQSSASPTKPGQSSGAPTAALKPVPFTAVHIADEFWAPKIHTVLEATLPHCFEQCEKTGRLSNFDKAAGKVEGKFTGLFFDDSDVYKVIEGAAYALMHERDEELENYVDGVIERIAAAQQPDGYLNSYFILTPEEARWQNTRVRHELYCAGHMIEAAVAYYQATGKRRLLDTAIKLADHIDDTFGPGKSMHVPGHQEIELALIKLYHLTNETRYLKLAEFFIEQRGRAEGRELYGEYCQDHAPIREQTKVVGHAVRAMYLFSGVADLAAITGDQSLIETLRRVWDDTILTKMYITGGIGSSSSNEGFTEAFDLPNETAYCETCAAIGLCLWNSRMNLLTADAKYVDVVERAMYNNVLSGLALDGRSFFYVNPLASTGGHHRQEWFRCACCPPNVVRFIPSVGGYVYASSTEAIYVNLYIGGTGEIRLDEERTVKVEQLTRYPWDGKVEIRLTPTGPAGFDVYLRIPAWSREASIAVNGVTIERPEKSRGYAKVHCEGSRGYRIDLNFPMPVERIQADSRVKANLGRVALQRGPVVYCLENVDNAVDVRTILLPPTGKEFAIEDKADLLGGVTVIQGQGLTARATSSEDWDTPLYIPAPLVAHQSFTAVPYFAWDNRAAGAMVVWLPESFTMLDRPPVGWITASASHCYQGDSPAAMHDRKEPADSNGRGLPRFTWWPHKGTAEWVQYDFDRPRRISSVDVYWFDDSQAKGECRAPKSWKLLYQEGEQWREVHQPSGYGVELDRYNRASFTPVETKALRIEVQLPKQFSAGILEWKVGQLK